MEKIIKMLKPLAFFIILTFFFFGVIYLLGAFINASLDITKWSSLSRLRIGVLGSLISITCSSLLAVGLVEIDPNKLS